MKKGRKKVCVLVCSAVPGISNEKFVSWLRELTEMSIIADIDVASVFSGVAADVGPESWISIGRAVYSRFDQYDGFVLVHGVDNLLYTAAAIGYLLQPLSKPIIFTGSYFGMEESKRIGIRSNLVNAVQVATSNLPEVALMFGNRLVRASQATQMAEESLNIFTGPTEAVLGRIDFSIRIFETRRPIPKSKIKFFDHVATNVEIVELGPLVDKKNIRKHLSDVEGLIVNAGGHQNISEAVTSLLRTMPPHVPTVVWSQSIEPLVIGPSNILIVTKMTWPATLTKFLWILGQTTQMKKVKEFMERDIVGELFNHHQL